MKSQYSDEMINAFVDDELDSRDRESIKRDMETDAELYETVKAVCALKKSLKQSYADLSLATHVPLNDSVINRYMGWRQSVAALLLICAGMVFGWYGNNGLQSFVKVNDLRGVQLTPVNLQQSNKIVLHVSSSDGDKLEKTLHQVEYIINQYQASQLPYEIEIIANSGGIDLLRQDVSPYADRVAHLMSKHDNISFIACSNAIEKLRLQGIEPRMIAHTRTGGTAIEQIVKRLQQGWVYIKV